MRFILFVEGYTEAAVLPLFLKRWLDPQLNQPIGIKSARFEGWADYRRNVRKKAHLYLNGPQSADIVAVIGLLDMYGPTFYPNHLSTANERYEWGKRNIEGEVGHPRFRHFFSVHEIEAWLLSQPELFPTPVRASLPGRVAQPETINFDEPPSRLLQRLYERRVKETYKKVAHGKDLFDRLNPSVAYNLCPHLKELLDEMLILAS